jgi:hypothetical protein
MVKRAQTGTLPCRSQALYSTFGPDRRAHFFSIFHDVEDEPLITKLGKRIFSGILSRILPTSGILSRILSNLGILSSGRSF